MIHEYIYALRNDELTLFFKFFPMLMSDYFYISFFAIGYWCYPKKNIYKSLILLVPYNVIINVFVKNLFAISRPDSMWHIIKVMPSDIYGFPSGDAQVAAAFWGCMFLSCKKTYRYLFLLPIILIACSRVYLGVHSIYDVFFGVILGFLIAFLYLKFIEQDLLEGNFLHNFYYFLFFLLCFVFFHIGKPYAIMFCLSMGSLSGSILFFDTFIDKNRSPMNLPYAIIFLILLVIVNLQINLHSLEHYDLFFLFVYIKYAFISSLMVFLLPLLYKKIS